MAGQRCRIEDDVHGWNTGDGNGTLQNSYGHGTAMASIIREIAPQARIMVLMINPDGQGSITEGALLEELQYAKHNGANIVNGPEHCLIHGA